MIEYYWVFIAQTIALMASVLALFAYWRWHPSSKAMFRIEKVSFHDGNDIFYIMRRWPFGVWKVWEIEPQIRGYRTQAEAQHVLENKISELGLSMSETEVVKEYG